MDRSHTQSVIQGDVELHDISASPSVEMSRLLTPSLPDDKLQGEMSLDFDSSCNAHDSVLGSSFPLGRETDVSMGEDECLDLSVTPSFETGLSDYAPTCFDSGTITHSIHTHPVCAVAESVSSFVGKDRHGDRSQQDPAQILSASPFILGSTSAANFVNAVLENLSSRSPSILHPTPSIFSVAPGIFILNTMGTPGIIDLPLRTNPPLADITPCVSVAMSSAPLGHAHSEVQPLGNRDSSSLNSLVSPKIINLQIRTVPIDEQFPVVSSEDSSTVMPSNLNLPLHVTPHCFSENTSSSSYLTFDSDMTMSLSDIHTDSAVQLEDRKLSLEETYCTMIGERQGEVNVKNLEIQAPAEMCNESQRDDSFNIITEKVPTISTFTESSRLKNMHMFDPVVKKELTLETVEHSGENEGHCNEPVTSNLMCSVENNLWSNLTRFCTFSVKSDGENTKDVPDNMMHFTTNDESVSADNVENLNGETHNHGHIKLEETVFYNTDSCKVMQDCQLQNFKMMTNSKNITINYKEKDLGATCMNQDDLASSIEGNSSEVHPNTNFKNSVSVPVTLATGTTCEDDVTSEQLSWNRCNNAELSETVTMVTRKGSENSEEVNCLEDSKIKTSLIFQSDQELKLEGSGEPTPVLETISQHSTPVKESSLNGDKNEHFSILSQDKVDIFTPTASEVHISEGEGSELMACTSESADNELCEQEAQQTTEMTINECELCSATFTRIGNYKRHLKLHDFKLWNNSRYKCDKCDRSFLQHCDLKRHALIHENREPYKCSVCGKGYIRKSDLVVHLRFHNKEKTFKCDQCTKSYYQNGDLKRHMRTHTRQELLTCAYCGRKLARQTTLLQHMQTKHKDIIIETFQSVEKHKQNGEIVT